MHRAPTWVERVARIGIVAKAIVYLAVGSLAVGVALQVGGALTGGEGLLHLLVRQPMGRALLAVLGLGLAAYTVWLFAQAFVDPDGNGTSFVGIVNRIGQVITGLAHIALTWEAVRLALGLPSGNGAGVEGIVRRTLQAPYGTALIQVAGAVVVVLGLIQVGKGLLGDVRQNWRLRSLDPAEHPWPLRIGRFGLAARGVVLGVAGVLVFQAGANYQPQKAGGVEDVLHQLWSQPPSGWVLGLVALGLVAYGAFALVEARYRFIPSA